MKAFFLIQKFESKPKLEDSAGYQELVCPLVDSGVIDDYLIADFGQDLDYYDRYIETQVDHLVTQLGTTPVIIYGAGAHTERYLRYYTRLNIVALSDTDARLWHTSRYGYPVVPPKDITEYAADVVISTRAYESSLYLSLKEQLPAKVNLFKLYDQEQNRKKQWLDNKLKSLEQEISRYKPDVIFYTPSLPDESIPPDWFSTLRKTLPDLKVVMIWWDYDEILLNSPFLEYEKRSLEHADLILDYSNNTRLQAIREGAYPYDDCIIKSQLHFLPAPANPKVFCPVDKLPDIEIAIFGSIVGERESWIDKLKVCYGEDFQHFGGVYKNANPMTIDDYASHISRTKIAINTQTYSMRCQCKGKVRETLASGVFLLEQDNPETRALVPEYSGLVYFSDLNDLIEKIDFYRSHQQERNAIIEAGLKWQKENYSTTIWAKKIMTYLRHEI